MKVFICINEHKDSLITRILDASPCAYKSRNIRRIQSVCNAIMEKALKFRYLFLVFWLCVLSQTEASRDGFNVYKGWNKLKTY